MYLGDLAESFGYGNQSQPSGESQMFCKKSDCSIVPMKPMKVGEGKGAANQSLSGWKHLRHGRPVTDVK